MGLHHLSSPFLIGTSHSRISLLSEKAQVPVGRLSSELVSLHLLNLLPFPFTVFVLSRHPMRLQSFSLGFLILSFHDPREGKSSLLFLKVYISNHREDSSPVWVMCPFQTIDSGLGPEMLQEARSGSQRHPFGRV